MLCRICNGPTQKIFSEVVLSKHLVDYYQCSLCKAIQTEVPYWLSEAYENPIQASDTGIIVRNETLRKIVGTILLCYFKKNGKYIDYAGGYGLFTRMMRDIGYDFYWTDEYVVNLLSRGFEHKNNTRYEAATAFEVFEHLVSPMDEIKKMLTYSDAIIFSTVLIPDPVPAKSWWYYGFNHGQHVSIYHYHTLQYIADKLGLHLYSDKKAYHVLSRKKLWMLNMFIVKRINKLGLFALVKLLLKSKTTTDHHYFVDKPKKHN